MSGGEKARLALACLLLYPINLLVLDEPTNHLDLQSKEVLKRALQGYDGSMIVVSHDRDFLSGLTDKVIEFRDHKLKTYLGDVNYFLQKRAIDNMRDVAKREVEQRVVIPEVKMDRQERKKILRKINYLERDIQKLEEEKETLTEAMYDPTFFEQPDHKEKMQRLTDIEDQTGQLWSEWETLSEKTGVMNITLVEPFYTGSHRQWAINLQKYSRHNISILSLPGRFWKWRMHGAAVTLASRMNNLLEIPDLLVVTDMLDVAVFKALLDQRFSAIPILLYFHENQITYPWSLDDPDPGLQRDRHYGFINYTSCLAADRIAF